MSTPVPINAETILTNNQIALESTTTVEDINDKITLFSDVSLDHKYFKPIYALVSAGILTGYPDQTFRPLGNITRAEIAAMLCRAFEIEPEIGETIFKDLLYAQWAEKYINPLAKKEIFKGVGEGLFDPNSNITNAEVAALMVRLINRFNQEATHVNDIPVFSDENKIAEWAKEVSKEAIAYGVMEANNNFNPQEIVTREKLSNILLKTMEKINNKKYGIKTIVEYTYGDWITQEPVVSKDIDYCDNITKKTLVVYGHGEFIYNPIENNSNAKWSPWVPGIPSVNEEYKESLANNKAVYNDDGQLILKLEEKKGEKGILYRMLYDRYRYLLIYYQIREKNNERIIYPGTISLKEESKPKILALKN